MADFRKLALDLIAADGRVDESEVKLLRRALYEDGVIDAEEVEFLMELRSAVNRKTQGKNTAEFDKFFLKALGDAILADGKISKAEATTLKKVVGDKKLKGDEVQRFLDRLQKEATRVAPEFKKLCASHAKKMK